MYNFGKLSVNSTKTIRDGIRVLSARTSFLTSFLYYFYEICFLGYYAPFCECITLLSHEFCEQLEIRIPLFVTRNGLILII